MLSHTAVFAPPTSILAHPENAHAKLRELISSLRDVTSTLRHQESNAESDVPEEEVSKLKEQIESLRTQLGKEYSSYYSAHTHIFIQNNPANQQPKPATTRRKFSTNLPNMLQSVCRLVVNPLQQRPLRSVWNLSVSRSSMSCENS